MKKTVISLLLLFVLVLFKSGEARSMATKGDSLRLFLIGNSFSQNATRYLPKLAEEGGHPLKIGRAELGGCSLQRHWDIAEAAEKNPDDPKGKAYNGKSLRELLSAGKWDVVTIQQNSMNSGDSTTYMPYAKRLVDLVKSIQPDAKIIMQQTWAYRVDAKKFTQVSDNQFASDAKEMWGKSRVAYHKIATELCIGLFPVGDAFWQVNSNPATAYIADSKFDIASAIYPDLPEQKNSLHVGYKYNNSKKLDFDANHANEAGCYLGGLVWYSVLFNENPEKLKFRPEQVSGEFAKALKRTAYEVVRHK